LDLSLQFSNGSLEILPLLRYSRLEVFALLLDLSMFFEELVEQHRVDRLVAHVLDFAFLVSDGQLRGYLSHILGDQPIVEALLRINFFLEAERDRFEREKRFASLVHGFDVLFVTARGNLVTKSPVGKSDVHVVEG